MDELDDLDAYNGGTVHDMFVEYDYHIITNEDIDTFFINKLNYWD